MLFLLFIIALIIGIATLLKWKKSQPKQETFRRLATQFKLSPLETSILNDIYNKYRNYPIHIILYELFCKNIRDDVKCLIANHLAPKFNSKSIEGEHINAFFQEYYRVVAPTHSAPTIELVEQKTARRSPPPPSTRRPEDFDILDFIPQNELEQQVRELTNIRKRWKPKHIYNSYQNVHIVNKGALESAEKLLKDYKENIPIGIDEEIQMLVRNAPSSDIKEITLTIETINTSKSKYGYSAPFTLKTLFHCVIARIKDASRDEQVELTRRLYEELVSMCKQCGTGHLVRLVNVFQGFDSKYSVSLPIDAEVYARISTFIQSDMENSSNLDDILESPDTIKEFVLSKRADYTEKIHGEYTSISSRDDIDKAIKLALNKYTKSDIF